jgi:hypothetical protein
MWEAPSLMLLVFPQNIRSGQEGQAVTNTLAYYRTLITTPEKGFIVIAIR